MKDTTFKYWLDKAEKLIDAMPELTANRVSGAIISEMPCCSMSRDDMDRFTLEVCKIRLSRQFKIFDKNKYKTFRQALQVILNK